MDPASQAGLQFLERILVLMNKIRVSSPAKVNLFLKVLRKRKDGYHQILSWIQLVDLEDRIEIERTERGIKIACDHPGVPTGKSNLAYRAAQVFLMQSKIKSGVRIKLKKKIPVAAGLGGGSSNAASVLYGLNRLLGNQLSASKILSLARTLGSDVPFFLSFGSGLASGRGEIVRSIKLPLNYRLVLVNPGFEVSTRWAYSKVKPGNIFPQKVLKLKRVTFRQMLSIAREIGNDLESVVEQKYPVIKLMVQKLYEQGALHAAMTGSGPTVFGIFTDKAKALGAAKGLRQGNSWRTWVATPIRRR